MKTVMNIVITITSVVGLLLLLFFFTPCRAGMICKETWIKCIFLMSTIFLLSLLNYADLNDAIKRFNLINMFAICVFLNLFPMTICHAPDMACFAMKDYVQTFAIYQGIEIVVLLIITIGSSVKKIRDIKIKNKKENVVNV